MICVWLPYPRYSLLEESEFGRTLFDVGKNQILIILYTFRILVNGGLGLYLINFYQYPHSDYGVSH